MTPAEYEQLVGVIPVRRRAVLPPGHWWIVHQPENGRLTVILAVVVPVDGELEQDLVRDAVQAWRAYLRTVN